MIYLAIFGGGEHEWAKLGYSEAPFQKFTNGPLR